MMAPRLVAARKQPPKGRKSRKPAEPVKTTSPLGSYVLPDESNTLPWPPTTTVADTAHVEIGYANTLDLLERAADVWKDYLRQENGVVPDIDGRDVAIMVVAVLALDLSNRVVSNAGREKVDLSETTLDAMARFTIAGQCATRPHPSVAAE